MERKCLFCGNEDLSNEHIIAQWMLKELKIDKEFISMSHLSVVGFENSKRKHQFSKLINGLVCKVCNNGWMSELESRNQNFLIDLLNYNEPEKSIEYLITNNIDFSKWAFKNAILFNSATNYRKLVPKEHFKQLYKGELPKNVYVHIGFSNNESIVETRQSPIHLVTKSKEIATKFKLNESYRITMKFKHLLIKVVYYKSANNIFYEDNGAFEIFPYVHLMEKFKTFESIDEFDLNGVIHEFV